MLLLCEHTGPDISVRLGEVDNSVGAHFLGSSRYIVFLFFGVGASCATGAAYMRVDAAVRQCGSRRVVMKERTSFSGESRA